MKDKLLCHQSTDEKIKGFLSKPSAGLALIGEPGAGKTYLSGYIAARLLGLADLSKVSTSPNILRVDGAGDSGIDAVRQLQNQLTLTTPGSNSIRRVVILEHFDLLGHEAQNALLKTLEEPPIDTVILLTIDRADNVLPTIYSRIASIEVRPISLQLALSSLGMASSKDEITKAFRMSGGHVGLLVSLLRGDQEHPLVLVINEAKALLASSRYQRMSQVDKLIKAKSPSINLILDGIFRVLEAAQKQYIDKNNIAKIENVHNKLRLTIDAINDSASGVNQKLVLTRLFLSL